MHSKVSVSPQENGVLEIFSKSKLMTFVIVNFQIEPRYE